MYPDPVFELSARIENAYGPLMTYRYTYPGTPIRLPLPQTRLNKKQNQFRSSSEAPTNVALPYDTAQSCILRLQFQSVLQLQQSQNVRLHTTEIFVLPTPFPTRLLCAALARITSNGL